MMVGDPCPLHKHSHTIVGLMDAHKTIIVTQMLPNTHVRLVATVVMYHHSHRTNKTRDFGKKFYQFVS